MQGNFNIITSKKDNPKKFRDERQEEKWEYGKEKTKKTRQREKARRTKREERWNDL